MVTRSTPPLKAGGSCPSAVVRPEAPERLPPTRSVPADRAITPDNIKVPAM